MTNEATKYFLTRKKALDGRSLRRKSLEIVDEDYSTKYINNIAVKMVRAIL